MSTFTKSIEMVEKVSRPLIVASSGGPVTRHRSRYPADMPYAYGYSWEWEKAPESTRAALVALWKATYGGADIFQWTPPGESEQDFQFVPGSLQIQGNPAPHWWSISVAVAPLRNST